VSRAVKQHGGLKTAPFEPADATAIQAVFNGTADEEQQRRAMRWLLDYACGVHEMSYTPGDQYATAFKEGQRFVAKQIGEVLRTNVPGLIETLRRQHDAQK